MHSLFILAVFYKGSPRTDMQQRFRSKSSSSAQAWWGLRCGPHREGQPGAWGCNGKSRKWKLGRSCGSPVKDAVSGAGKLLHQLPRDTAPILHRKLVFMFAKWAGSANKWVKVRNYLASVLEIRIYKKKISKKLSN